MATGTQPAAVTAHDVEDARHRLSQVLAPTPLQRSDRLGARTGGEVWLKREDLQPVRSYKVRGAYNLISQLGPDARAAGVVCASAGNHAQGLAYACARLGVSGRVYLPRTTPRQKRDRIAVLGGDLVEIRVLGDTYDDAAAEAVADAARTGATLVPAFDHPLTVAGQGTAVAEAFSQLEELGRALPDIVVIPVGGGGLLAGAATWLTERHPEVRLVGVEPAGAACMAAALQAGEPVTLPEIDGFVDGAAVRRAGAVTYPIIRDTKVEVVSVAEGRVCSEMLELYQADGIIAEPAGALAAAALGEVVRPHPEASVLVLLSGGNNDVSRYAEVVERALIHEGRKHYFLVDFPQEPGALRRFLDDVLGPDDDITLFEYVKRNNRETGPALVGVELGSPADLPALLARMEASPPNIEKIPANSPLFRYLL
ncbi:threonine ammonia-lyase IlvA [Kineosporia rhizophila]|uniref:threonine ammonia-lyase IlvA n=1 Tax=Kineosporia TaxID=49184 RepID=UPI001E4437CD|nr:MULTISPECIES: threonine ammonia-lyase IlvA [Kineosporia]MCE0540596.1 threonine ammonia-lyase IlvA [Kineosporia rhizophila]